MLKFRDPTTGTIFEDIEKACNWYCDWRFCDRDCILYRKSPDCVTYCKEHPVAAAEMMGLVAFDDGTVFFPVYSETEKQEGNMDKQDKSHLAEVLGVEDDEEWESCSAVCRIHNGFREIKRANGWEKADNETFLTTLINHPNYITRIPRPRLSEQELERCRVFGAKYVSRDGGYDWTNWVELWDEKPEATEIEGEKIFSIDENTDPIARASARFFPSVKLGELIGVEEMRA